MFSSVTEPDSLVALAESSQTFNWLATAGCNATPVHKPPAEAVGCLTVCSLTKTYLYNFPHSIVLYLLWNCIVMNRTG